MNKVLFEAFLNEKKKKKKIKKMLLMQEHKIRGFTVALFLPSNFLNFGKEKNRI
jgi:hypothetical protein